MSKLTGLEQDVLDLEAKYDAMDISSEHRCRLSVDKLINDCMCRAIRGSEGLLVATHLREAVLHSRNEIARLRLVIETMEREARRTK